MSDWPEVPDLTPVWPTDDNCACGSKHVSAYPTAEGDVPEAPIGRGLGILGEDYTIPTQADMNEVAKREGYEVFIAESPPDVRDPTAAELAWMQAEAIKRSEPVPEGYPEAEWYEDYDAYMYGEFPEDVPMDMPPLDEDKERDEYQHKISVADGDIIYDPLCQICKDDGEKLDTEREEQRQAADDEARGMYYMTMDPGLKSDYLEEVRTSIEISEGIRADIEEMELERLQTEAAEYSKWEGTPDEVIINKDGVDLEGQIPTITAPSEVYMTAEEARDLLQRGFEEPTEEVFFTVKEYGNLEYDERANKLERDEVMVTDPETGGSKAAKLARMELIDPEFLWYVAEVMGFGLAKYGHDNWKGVKDTSLFLGAAQRHIALHAMGETIDPESGRPHLAHATAVLMMAWWLGEYAEE